MPGTHKKNKKGIPSYQKKRNKSSSFTKKDLLDRVNYLTRKIRHEKAWGNPTGQLEEALEKNINHPLLSNSIVDMDPHYAERDLDDLINIGIARTREGIPSYQKERNKKFSALEESVSAPRKIKPEGKPEEELIYANKEEISMLKKAGGMGVPTQYGVRSFIEGKGQDAQIKEQKENEQNNNNNDQGDQGDDSRDTGSPSVDKKEYGKAIKKAKERSIEAYHKKWMENNPPGDDNNNLPTFNTSNITETEAFSGTPISLKGLYDNQNDLTTYLTGKGSSTRTEKRKVPAGYSNSGQEYTVTINEEGDPLADTVDPSQPLEFQTDKEGNIIGWYDGEGTPQFENRDEWYVDSDGNWFFVGEGAMEGVGAGGSGETTILTADGESKTIGARTYADLIGFDQTLLDDAIADRQQNIAEFKSREEDYGGAYTDASGKRPGEAGFDSSTAKFRGGKAQKMYDKADQYTSAYDTMMADATGYTIDPVTGEYKKTKDTEFDRLTGKAEDEYTRLSEEAEAKLREGEGVASGYAARAGVEADRAAGLGAEAGRLAMDSEFYGGLQKDTDAIQRDQQAYRGRIQEMADSVGVTPRGKQSALYAMRSEQIDKDSGAQQKQLQSMLAERGISPTSPVALRMMSGIKSGSATQKREARRQALFDAMQMQGAENQQRASMFAQASGMAGQELGTIGQKAGIRSGRIRDITGAQAGALATSDQLSRLGTAATSDSLARAETMQGMAGDRGQFYAGLGATKMQTQLQGAGMQAAQSSQMFSRGTYFGNQAQSINQLRLADAMDRQAGQEYKKLTGMSMDLSKYGVDKQAEIQDKLATLNSSYKEGGSGTNLIGSLIGGVGGYFLSGGNPYMAGLGANWGSQIKW